MEEDLDEFGEPIGEEYSSSDVSGPDEAWEDLNSDGGSATEESEPYQYDTQDVSVPLVQVKKEHSISTVKPSMTEYLMKLMSEAPGLVRSVGIVGPMCYGKSALYSWMLEDCINDPKPQHAISSDKRHSNEANFASYLTADSRGKTFVFNVTVTPGHLDFELEASNALSLCDSEIHVIDPVQYSGSPLSDSRPRLVVFNKLDRLIIEQSLPPAHFFRRLLLLTEQLDVRLKDVVFMSTRFRFAFTLSSVTQLYRKYGDRIDSIDLEAENNFVQYVAQPLYKLFSGGLIGKKSRPGFLRTGIDLTDEEWDSPAQERISLLCAHFFENGLKCLIDKIVDISLPQMRPANPSTTYKKLHRDRIIAISKANEPQNGPGIYLPYGDEMIAVESVPKGAWYLTTVSRSDTSLQSSKPVPTRSVFQVQVEPKALTTKALEHLEQGIGLASEVFCALRAEATERDTFLLCSSGEYYMESVLSFLATNAYDFKVSHPTVEFQETVTTDSYIQFPTRVPTSPGASVTIIAAKAEQVDDGGKHIWARTHLNNSLTGPFPKEDCESNLLESIMAGFMWFVDSGPLQEGKVRDVKIHIVKMDIEHTSPQVSSTVYRACCSAMLLASPRLVEPVYEVVVTGKLEAGKACYSELEKRGGDVVSDEPIVGTNLYKTTGVIPVIDSLGLLVSIKCQMREANLADVALTFLEWRVVSGDPLDSQIPTMRLRPASGEERARDFLLKTRHWKGLSSEPDLNRFVDKEVRHIISDGRDNLSAF